MLEKLAENHKIWLRMVKGFGADKETAQDLVQSMYLRIHKYVKDEKRIMYNDDEVNRFFIYVTLKNMYNSYMTARHKFIWYEIREDDVIDTELREFCFDEAIDTFDDLIAKVNDKSVDNRKKHLKGVNQELEDRGRALIEKINKLG